MRHIFFTAIETLRLLMRDKVFVPAIISSLMIGAVAYIASEWSVLDYQRVLFDIENFGFNLTGALVALFWGHRIISDSRQEGSLEVQLAAPLSRTSWLLGKYLGLAASLVILGGIMMAVWQGFLLVIGHGALTFPDLWISLFSILGWLVLAAAAIFFATFTGPQVALFSTICVWLIGLSINLVGSTLDAETSPILRKVIDFLGRYWDFQQFNLSAWTSLGLTITNEELAWRGCYGLSLILVLFTCSALIFRRRDLMG